MRNVFLLANILQNLHTIDFTFDHIRIGNFFYSFILSWCSNDLIYECEKFAKKNRFFFFQKSVFGVLIRTTLIIILGILKRLFLGILFRFLMIKLKCMSINARTETDNMCRILTLLFEFLKCYKISISIKYLFILVGTRMWDH